MEAEGQRSSSNPSAVLAALLSKRAKLHEDLRNLEKQVYDMETIYLQDPSQCGNVLKGFEGFLSSSKSTSLNPLQYVLVGWTVCPVNWFNCVQVEMDSTDIRILPSIFLVFTLNHMTITRRVGKLEAVQEVPT